MSRASFCGVLCGRTIASASHYFRFSLRREAQQYIGPVAIRPYTEHFIQYEGCEVVNYIATRHRRSSRTVPAISRCNYRILQRQKSTKKRNQIEPFTRIVDYYSDLSTGPV
jgi:hypothetical protein